MKEENLMRVNQRKAGVILTYLAQTIHILSGLLYTPIMLRLLGQSEYGLYQLVASVVSYLSVLSLGFSSSYMRFYSRIKKNGSQDDVAQFNGMFMTIFLVISVICLMCGGVMLANIKAIFGNGLTEVEYSKARILLALMVFNLALTFPGSVYDSFMVSHEQFLFQRLLKVLQYLFNPFITLPLLLMGYGSVAMVLVSSGFTIAQLISSMIYCNKVLHIQMQFKRFQLGLLKEMWVFTIFIFINMIVDQINWSVDKFLLGRFCGTVSVAIYGIGAQLNGMYRQVSTAVSNVFVPQVNRIVVESDDKQVLTELFTKVGRFQFILLAGIVIGFIFLGRDFILLWAGSGYELSYGITLLLIIPVTMPLIQNLGIEIQRAKNMHQIRSIVYLGIAISNVILSIVLIQVMGELGAAWGTALSLLAGNCVFMNIYYHKKIGIDVLYFWKEIAKFIPALIFPILTGAVLGYMIDLSNFYGFFMAGVIYLTVYIICMWKFGLNQKERQTLAGPLLRIVKNIRRKV